MTYDIKVFMDDEGKVPEPPRPALQVTVTLDSGETWCLWFTKNESIGAIADVFDNAQLMEENWSPNLTN